MNQKPSINYSIIIPHHEIPQLLGRCIKSIPERDDVEIIVVDDNSKNNEDYVGMYSFLQRKNLTYIPTKEGRGAGYARNVGLDHASGKWLLFADADDFYAPILSDVLDEYVKSTYDVIFFDVDCVLSDDITKKANKGKQRLFEMYRKSGDINLFKVRYSEPWGKIVRKSIVDENHIRFDEVKVSNDFYFSVQSAFLAKSIKIDNRQLYVYTARENSLSWKGADTLEKIRIRLDVYSRVAVFIKGYGLNFEPLNLMIRGLLVALLKRHPLHLPSELLKLRQKGLSVFEFIVYMFSPKYTRLGRKTANSTK